MRPDRRIPDSYARIWKTVTRIPTGRVSTYGTVARLTGLPSHARLVGYALHALPKGSMVPWHRVINAQGKISLRRVSGGDIRQEKMLAREGVVVVDGKIDLGRFGWPGKTSPPSNNIREQGGKRTRSRQS